MRVTHFSSPVFIDGVEISGRKKYHLDTATILGAMSSSYTSLEGLPGEDIIVKPGSDILVVYNAGSQAFGANPGLQIGYPNLQGIFGNAAVGIAQVLSQGKIFAGGSPASVLTDFVNQPLIANFADASATYGPITASHLTGLGTNWAPNDTALFDEDDTSPTLTVLTVNGSGGILTYSIDDSPTRLGIFALTSPSGAGTGGSISIDAITQGNGSLDLYFVPEFIDLS